MYTCIDTLDIWYKHTKLEVHSMYTMEPEPALPYKFKYIAVGALAIQVVQCCI